MGKMGMVSLGHHLDTPNDWPGGVSMEHCLLVNWCGRIQSPVSGTIPKKVDLGCIDKSGAGHTSIFPLVYLQAPSWSHCFGFTWWIVTWEMKLAPPFSGYFGQCFITAVATKPEQPHPQQTRWWNWMYCLGAKEELWPFQIVFPGIIVKQLVAIYKKWQL